MQKTTTTTPSCLKGGTGKTGQSFDNDIDGGLNFWPRKIINKGIMLDYAEAFKLNETAKNIPVKDQSGNLSGVVKALTEVSDPVLIVLKK